MTAVATCHHVPGRIRLRLAALKQFPDASEWLKSSLMGVDGINAVRVNHVAHSVVIQYDTKQLTPELVEERLAQVQWHQAELEEPEHEFTQGDVALNALATLTTLFLPRRWGAVTTYPLILPQMIEGVMQLTQGKINIEVLDAIALGLSSSRGDYKTAMLTATLLSLGEYMEQATSRSSDDLLASLMQPTVCDVWVEREGNQQRLSSEDLVPGDVMLLGPGDPIPADGHILRGSALINQASLTGESVPVRREETAYLMAGTTVHEGNISVRVKSVGEESTTARIAKLIYDSLSTKSETQQVTQAMAERRVKITLGVGAVVFALTRDPERLASVFLVDYSCALKLSTPVTFKSMMYRAANEGIVLKGGRSMEQLAKVDTVVFDKTGTLTHGDMEVTDVISLKNGTGAKRMLAIAASVEEHSNHPLAQAIVNAARKHELPHIDHGEVEYVIAHGLRSSFDGESLDIGSRHFLETHLDIDFSNNEEKIQEFAQQGKHQLYVASKGELIGIIALRDQLRDDVDTVLQALRDSGISQLVMLSGDGRAKAEQLGAELGLDRVYAEATPESKSEIIEELQLLGHKVMFVGDGVNDGPALTQADVGIAMNQGTELARQAADVVLMQDNLQGVAKARTLALQAMNLINSNIRITEVVNTGIMLFAALGYLNPALSAALHNGTTLSILARSVAAKNAQS